MSCSTPAADLSAREAWMYRANDRSQTAVRGNTSLQVGDTVRSLQFVNATPKSHLKKKSYWGSKIASLFVGSTAGERWNVWQKQPPRQTTNLMLNLVVMIAILTIWPAASSPLKSSSKCYWYFWRFRLKKEGWLIRMSLSGLHLVYLGFFNWICLLMRVLKI